MIRPTLACVLLVFACSSCDRIGRPAVVGVGAPGEVDLRAWDANLTRANEMIRNGDAAGAGSVLGELSRLIPRNDALRHEQFRDAQQRLDGLRNGRSGAAPVNLPTTVPTPATHPVPDPLER